MLRSFLCLLCSVCLWPRVSSGEESFCGNRCLGEGVITSRSCFCDEACATYRDCCSDSEHLLLLGAAAANATSRSAACRSGIMMVDGCSDEWSGPEFIVKSCRTASASDVDPVGNAPVTSETTGLTYANYYCAICSGDAEKIVVWNIKMSCPLLNPDVKMDKDEAFKYIFYNHPTKEWGYVLRDESSKKLSFHGCAVASERPDIPNMAIRSCEADEVRSCAQSWKMQAIARMCEGSYADPVYSNGTRYKNFYCAVCNGVDQSTLTCGQAVGPRSNARPEPKEKNNLSFSLLLDINFSEGNAVGKRIAATSCLKGEIFDPFARRCRNIVCGVPGYIPKDGICVPDLVPPLR